MVLVNPGRVLTVGAGLIMSLLKAADVALIPVTAGLDGVTAGVQGEQE